MKLILPLILLALGLSLEGASAQILYSNSGDNTTGFTVMYDLNGTASLTSNGTDLVVSNGGMWDSLPVDVSGNFQISFDIYNNSNDGDSHLLLFNPATNGGLDIRNSPQGTDTPSINIFSGTNFVNYNQFFFPTAGATLATATTASFPNQTWTHVVITKTGNIITDDVGGQVIQANVGSLGLPNTLQIGLGAYATTYNGGVGQLLYRNLIVTPEPSTFYLLGLGLLVGMIGISRRRSRSA